MTPKPRRSLFAVVLAVTALLLLGGCMTPTYEVKVDAISKPLPSEAVSYKIKNKNPTAGEDSLRYKETAEVVKTALSGKGMYEAADTEAADMIVEIDYGMQAPRIKIETVSVPIYARVDGGVRYEQVAVTDRRGNVTYRTVPVFEPPRTELIGFDEEPRPVSVYEKYLHITARENKPSVEGKPAGEIWSVYVTSEDESRDLRKYIPILASASIDYIGKDSSNQTVVKVKENAPGVSFVKKGMNPDSPEESSGKNVAPVSRATPKT